LGCCMALAYSVSCGVWGFDGLAIVLEAGRLPCFGVIGA